MQPIALRTKHQSTCKNCHKTIPAGFRCFWRAGEGTWHFDCKRPKLGNKKSKLPCLHLPLMPTDRNYATATRPDPLMRRSSTDKYSAPRYSL